MPKKELFEKFRKGEPMTREELLKLAIMDVQQEPYTAYERGKLFKSMLKFEFTKEDIEEIGYSKKEIELGLLLVEKLHEDIGKLVTDFPEEGKSITKTITSDKAKALCKLSKPIQLKVAKVIQSYGCSVREVRSMVRQVSKGERFIFLDKYQVLDLGKD